MSRYYALAALAALLALPATAQNTCNLQIAVSCTTPTGGASSSCTSTTLNADTANACTGEYFSGYFVYGAAKAGGFSTTLGLSECFDSSILPTPTPGQSWVFCAGNASLAPNGTFTASASVTGTASQIIGVTGVFDPATGVQKGFVYAQANVTALTCTPSPDVPKKTLSGVDYLVTWSRVSDPAAAFVLDESTDPTFQTGVTEFDNINGISRTFNHTVSAPTTYYYRVKAKSCAGGTPDWSATAATTVEPPPPPEPTSGNPTITIPFGTTQPVPIKVFIPGVSVPATFSASTDKPYLTVSPSSGDLPTTGTVVTITAAPGSLPVGASIGTLTVKITIPSASSAPAISGITPSDTTTTTNTPISINLVTPVQPSGKTIPPPNALIIPVVTHVNAAAGPFLSDIRLTNASSQPMNYLVTMTPTLTNGTASSLSTTITVAPQSTAALNDIVNNFFGFGATGDPHDVGFGALEIRPVDSGSLLTFASSRTYTAQAIGTFGQFISAIPFSKFATLVTSPIPIPGVGTHTTTKLSLQHVAQSTLFRTNFGLAEGSGQQAQGIIRIFDDLGHDLKDVPFDLQPGEQEQFNGFITANLPGTSLNDGRIEVEIASPTGGVTAYASVLDNGTNDPFAVTPVDVSAILSNRYILPGIAELNNGPTTNFHSDVRIFNGGSTDVTATLSYYPMLGLPGANPQTVAIPHGQIAKLDNILPTNFGVSGTGGAIVITTPSPSSLVATARTYTTVTNGTFGQFIPGVLPSDGIGVGDRPLQVLQLEDSDRFRSNLGLVELTGNPDLSANKLNVHISVYTPDSKITPSIDVQLGPNEFRQINGIISSILGKGTQTYNARVTIEVTSGSGRVSAYGSVIDNQSADPTYVPAQ